MFYYCMGLVFAISSTAAAAVVVIVIMVSLWCEQLRQLVARDRQILGKQRVRTVRY